MQRGGVHDLSEHAKIQSAVLLFSKSGIFSEI